MMTLINLIAFLAMVVVNALSATGFLGGKTTGEVSDAYQNLFTPAGWTFSIWGVIYLLLFVFVIAAFFNNSAKLATDQIGYWFFASCAFNILWVFAWHLDIIWLSMIMMIGLLVSLVVMFTRLSGMFNLFTAGFSVYLGWIMVATIANFVVLLVSLGVDGMNNGAQLFVVTVLPVAALLMASISFFRDDWLISLTGMFAFAGIIAKHVSKSGFSGKYTSVIASASIGAIILFIGIVYVFSTLMQVRAAAKGA